MASLLSFRRLTAALWLGMLILAGVAQVHSAAAQMYGNNGGYEGMRQTPSGRPTGAPEDEPRKQKSRPGEDVPLLATPSGAVSHNTQIERHIDDAPVAKAKPKEKLNLEETLYLDLSYGRVVIKLHPELAPHTVARFKQLVREGFYDGLVFHRVIEGFMAQTGDPRGDGTGGSGQNLNAEFNSGKHVRGSLSMARASNINSADSQFFIVLADAPHLDGQYTYFGEVVSGMEFVDQIRKGDPRRNGSVAYPDHILRIQVAADAAKSEKAEAAAGKPAKKSDEKGG
jgi:peptidylprolyl isomerase